MENLEPLRTEEDYEAALARIHELFHAPVGTPEGDELERLVDLVEVYSAKHYPIDPPGPFAAIEYYLDQNGLTLRDLIPFAGIDAIVAESSSAKLDWQKSVSLTSARQ